MNRIKTVIITSILFLFSITGNSEDIPGGGTNMIADAITNYTRIGSAGSVTVINVQDQNFSKALKIDVTSHTENYWNFQVEFKTLVKLEKDDICLVSFWGKCSKSESEAGEGLLNAVIEHNETYTKPLNKTFVLGGEWKHYFYAFKANMDLELSKHKAAFFLGYGIQTIEVADIQFLNYKKTVTIEDLPVMQVYYDGIEPDAAWRQEAKDRIDKFRKGDLNIKLVNNNNNPVSNTNVSIEMKRHKFGFGSAIDGTTYLNNATYRQKVHDLFNEVVFENDLKWRPWVNRSDHSYILDVINSLHENNIDARGHCMIWPGWQYLPDFMEDSKGDPSMLKMECLDHIEEVANFTKGKLIDWDILNEPYTNHVIQDICGDKVMADWFSKAKEIDPDVKKYINDYSILSNGGTDVNHQDGYYEIIQYIEEQGGQIDGIGMQGHFAEFVTGIPKIIEILDRFSSFNKEIKITEFDINSANDELKTKYTRDFLTVVFSHPYVKSLLSWGFWAGRHWKPEAAYFDMNWTIRPNGEVFKNLVKEEWWSPDSVLSTGAQGMVDFGPVFLGEYQVNIQKGEKTISKRVPVHFNSENIIIINVDNEEQDIQGTNHTDTPIFTSAGVFSSGNSNRMRIYPNPAEEWIEIETKYNTYGTHQLAIYDITGNCVLNKEISMLNKKRLQLPNLNQGIYFVTLVSNDKKQCEKLIIR